MNHVIKEAQTDAHRRPRAKGDMMPRQHNGPIRVIVPHPAAWARALELAGTHKRLFTVSDGVIVANSERRPAWA